MNLLETFRIMMRAGIVLIFAAASATSTTVQPVQIERFVSPSYPPLARQALISGQVTLDVTVNNDGSVKKTSEDLSAHPLLAQEAKACIAEWKFHAGSAERRTAVIFYYGFSGTTREINPRTTVTANFTEAAVRVYITTDPAPTEHPQTR
jgi:TonB family protein